MQSNYKRIALGLMALCLLLGGVLVMEAGYRGAVSALSDWSLSAWSFEEAQERLGAVPGFYRDARQLQRYVDAGMQFYAGNYEQAKVQFRELKDYRDSADFLLECEYRQAVMLLEQGRYPAARAVLPSILGYRDTAELLQVCDFHIALSQLDEQQYDLARAGFVALVQQGYAPAATALKDTDYALALAYMNAEDFAPALELLYALGDHLDAPQQLQTEKEAIYAKAQSYFNGPLQDNPDSLMGALYLFSLIPDHAQSAQYLQCINLMEATWEQPVFENTPDELAFERDTYQQYLALWDAGFDPAKGMIADYYFAYLMEGRWKGDGKSLRVSTNPKTGQTTYSHNLPGATDAYLKVEGGIFYTRKKAEDEWAEKYHFTLEDKDTIVFQVAGKEQRYTLKRQ